ncbi:MULTISPECIES: hydroxyacid dehydrogenase [Streptacidiphilus]|uniref:Hydroxyacid dehydrogenase n=1 Tax=Streptacidiphilus cavernicola TaxID=3342716 RepID=A0ABV6UI97_9ACTN|nr:hydroxyacid dehydrogenase [Streptacidiphilus jeojiense]
MVTGWGGPPIDAAVLDRAPRLRAVLHSAGSVKAFVGPEVFERGIQVSSAAGVNAVPVAEYTLAALVLAAKRVLPAGRRVPVDERQVTTPTGIGLRGRAVGVVGASRVGRLVVAGLVVAGARVLLADPYLGAEAASAMGAELTGLDALCRSCDLVTVHAPELPSTRHMFDRRRLGLLPDGTVLVNTSRGSLLDHEALAEECGAGRLAAVLDVTDPEPLPPDHPLLSLPEVLITPHVAGASGRERRLLGEFTAAEAERLTAGQALQGLVRWDELSRSA